MCGIAGIINLNLDLIPRLADKLDVELLGAANDKIQHVLNLLENFVLETYNLDKQLIAELIDFQKKSVIDYNNIKNYPVSGKYKRL